MIRLFRLPSILTVAGSLSAFCPVHAQWTHESPAELSVAADWDNDGRRDLLIVDRTTGLLRSARQQVSGAFVWDEPRAAGPAQPTAIAFGVFFGDPAPALAVTSPALNRLNLVRSASAEPAAWFVGGIGPRALAATLGGPAGGASNGNLYVATSDNGAPDPHRMESWKAPAVSAPVDAALARGNAVGTAGAFGFIARAVGGGPTDELRIFPAGSVAPAATAADLPAGSDWAWGQFGGGASSCLVWNRGSATLHHFPLTLSGPVPVFGVAATFTLSAPIFSVTVLAGGPSTRLLVVFNDGASAGVFTFDGISAPVLVQSLTPTVGDAFRTSLPLEGGDFALGSGLSGQTTTGSVRRWRRQGAGNYTADAPSNLPSLPSTGSARTNVLLFVGEPFVDSAANLVSALRARDWSVNTAGLPLNVQVGAETYQGSLTGLGARATVSLGASSLTGTHALTNQYAADLSVSSYAPASGPQRLAAALTPPPGAYADPVTVVASSTPSGPQIFVRTSPGAAWQLFDSTAPLHLTATTLVEAYAKNGFQRSPVIGGTYTVSPIAPSPLGGPDTNGNGLGDAWEQYFGKPAPDSDKDGDGATAAEEYAAGTDPCNPDSTPGTPDPAEPTLVFTAILPPPTSELHLRLHGKPGVRHVLQSSTTLAAGQWADVSAEFTMPAAGFADFSVPYVVGSRNFFRGQIR